MREKLNSLGVNDVNIYYDNGNTVVLLTTDTETARGIVVCSPRDNFSKAYSRPKAFGRAIKALVNKQDDLKINPLRFEHLQRVCDTFGLFKSAYNPELTDKELVIVHKHA